MGLSQFMVVAQMSDDDGGAMAALFGGVGSLVMLAIWILVIAGLWKMFAKAGEPGWASLIPIYNIFVLVKIAGRPAWWVLLMLLPFVNFIIFIILTLDLSGKFGKGVGYAVWMMVLPFIFYPMLGFSDATYSG